MAATAESAARIRMSTSGTMAPWIGRPRQAIAFPQSLPPNARVGGIYMKPAARTQGICTAGSVAEIALAQTSPPGPALLASATATTSDGILERARQTIG